PGGMDRSAGRMLGPARDGTDGEQRVLLKPRENSLGGAPGRSISRPLRHGAYRPSGTVAIIDFNGQAGRCEIRLDLFERNGHVPAQNAFGRVIAGKRAADEIVEPGIADVLGNAWIDIAKVNKAARQCRLRETWRHQA